MFEINNGLSVSDKLEILSDAAKYDVACTSSGVDRRGKEGFLGNSCSAGICHAFAADGRCISLLKILMSNHCIYDCKYCKNRVSNDIRRATFTPDEICNLTIEFYKRNYIEGLFLSSGIIVSPDYTMEKMCETLRLLRTVYKFNGYIHVKVIPGASSELLYSAGLLADRMSINMELPTEVSLKKLAPNKAMNNILRPMNQVTGTIAAHRLAIGKDARMERASINSHLVNSIFGPDGNDSIEIGSSKEYGIGGNGLSASHTEMRYSEQSSDNLINGEKRQAVADTVMAKSLSGNTAHKPSTQDRIKELSKDNTFNYPADPRDTMLKRPFSPAGQSTQMIIGATDETDLELITTTQNLYKSFDLKRVFYSGYIPINEDSALPALNTPVPMLREHRLYQADFLLRFYGFHAEELLSKEKPFFDNRIDPKCDWAIRHLGDFPVEINTATYDMLLRVPGIGPTGVKKIMSARRYGKVTFEMLKRMGIVLKRAQYFITCNGKMLYKIPIEQQYILACLADSQRSETIQITKDNEQFQQLNLFSSFGLTESVPMQASS
ncbi:MAG: putative DNA modification/repair radical SAM protein [Lachnospiraceae bacterium]|nr:putative DNA modification/repair radical SAM protein [Lachnospiraceae bacterium]